MGRIRIRTFSLQKELYAIETMTGSIPSDGECSAFKVWFDGLIYICRFGSSLFCVGGLESRGLTRNSKDSTAMTRSISIAHHARLIARLCLRD